tara:strand:- start:36877 stop:45756 length:8880 start_codon:yes stop_codon:yes gene_type:complete
MNLNELKELSSNPYKTEQEDEQRTSLQSTSAFDSYLGSQFKGYDADHYSKQDPTSWYMDFAGNLSWGTTSSATAGALDIYALTDLGKETRDTLSMGTYRPWEQQSGWGRAGYIIGSGLGMLVPFTGWAKALNWGTKALGYGSKTVIKGLTKQVGKELTEGYAEKKGMAVISNVISSVDDVGKATANKELFASLTDDVVNVLKNPNAKNIFKQNQLAFKTATKELSENIMKGPHAAKLRPIKDAGLIDEFSSALLSKTLEQGPHHLHKAIEMTFAGMGAGNLTGFGRVGARMASDAVLGFTYHTAQYALQNGVYQFTKNVANIDQEELEAGKDGMYRYLPGGKAHSAWGLLKDATKHAVAFSLIAPARFAPGGIAGSRRQDWKNTFRHVLKSTKSVRKLTNKEAIEGVGQIHNTMKNVSGTADKMGLRNFNFQSANLSKGFLDRWRLDPEKYGPMARETLKEARRLFAKSATKDVLTNTMKDVYGSLPRMIAGGTAMSLPSMVESLYHTGTLRGSMGETYQEIFSNMMVGMVLSKRGDTLYGTKNNGSRVFKTDPMKVSYTANVDRAKNIQIGLELLGIKTPMQTGAQDNNSSLLVRNHYQKSGPMAGVHELVKEYFVNKVEPGAEIPGTKDIISAYKEAIRTQGGNNPKRDQELHNAIEILEHFNARGVDTNFVLRDVLPSEAQAIVEGINNLPGVRENFNKPQDWIRQAEHQSLIAASLDYSQSIKDFVREMSTVFGREVREEAGSGRLEVPQFNLKQIESLLTYGKDAKEINTNKARWNKVKDIFTEVIKYNDMFKEGMEHTVNLSAENLAQVHKVYNDYTKQMNEKIAGVDPMYSDDFIISSSRLRTMYLETKQKEQIFNLLSVLTPEGMAGHGHTLDQGTILELNKQMQRLDLKTLDLNNLRGRDKVSEDQWLDITNKLNRFREIARLKVGDETQTGAPDRYLDIGTASKAIQSFEQAFGKDVFKSDKLFEQIRAESFDHFITSLNVNEKDFGYSSIQGLQLLFHGSVDKGKGFDGDFAINGVFTKRTKSGFELPSAKSLEQVLKNSLTKDQYESLKKVMPFYTELENILKGSGNVIQFNPNSQKVTEIIDSFGSAQNVLSFLRNAKHKSDLGNMMDVAKTGLEIADIQKDMDVLSAKVGVEVKGLESNIRKEMQDNLHILYSQLRETSNVLRMAKLTRNYKILQAMGGADKRLQNMTDSVKRFIGKNLEKEGEVNTKFEQELIDLVQKQKELLSQEWGEINNQTLGAFLEKEMSKADPGNLFEKESAMEVSITPGRFSAKYNLNINDVDIEPQILKYRFSSVAGQPGYKNPKFLERAADNLFRAIKFSATDKFKRADQEGGGARENLVSDVMTDIHQFIASKVFTKTIQSLEYKNGIFKVTESHMIPNEYVGIMGLDNFVLAKGSWFKMADTHTYYDPKSQTMKTTKNPNDKIIPGLEAAMAAGEVKFEYDLEKNYLSQSMNKDMEQMFNVMESDNLLRVPLGEGQVIAVSRDAQKAATSEAFSPKGKVYKELQKLRKIGLSEAEFNDLVRTYGNIEMTDAQVIASIDKVHTLLNNPVALVGKPNISEELNFIKRRQMTNQNTGKKLTPEYYEFLKTMYSYASGKGSTVHGQLEALYKGLDYKAGQKSITIADENVNSMFSAKKIAEIAYLKDKENGTITEAEYKSLVAEAAKDNRPATDSAMYVTLDNLLTHLGTLGARPDWFTFNNKGEISGMRLGAVKPKGVHVSMDNDGNVKVFYNKTAMFYDKNISIALKDSKLDQITFQSGTKVHDTYVGGKKKETLQKARTKKDQMNPEQTLTDYIVSHIKAHDGNKVDILPYDTYLIGNAGREHLGRAGSNMSVHLSGQLDIDVWTGTPQRVQDFKRIMLQMQKDPIYMTGYMKKLLNTFGETGDPSLSNMPYEHILHSDHLILEPFMGKVGIDKLFSYFYDGGKISSHEVANSSLNVMAPDIGTKVSNMNLPVRLDSEGIGRQRTYGQSNWNYFEGNQKFSYFGKSNSEGTSVHDGTVFGTKMKYSKDGGDKITADVLFVPRRGEYSKFDFIVDGYRISGNKIFDLASGKEVSRGDIKLFNMNGDKAEGLVLKQAKEVSEMFNKAVDKDMSNREVKDALYAYNKDFSLFSLDVRQPRNSMNDLVITKVGNILDKESGVQQNMNSHDALRTQDADNDFDKSTKFKSAPANLWAATAGNGGQQRSIMDSQSWASNLTKLIEIDMSKGNTSQYMNEWMSVKGSSDVFRGYFVKLHNSMSYFLNAFPSGIYGPGGKVAMTFKEGNTVYGVRMKDMANYKVVVDNVSDFVKKFIDNYKLAPSTENTEKIRNAIMFGDSGTREAGLFEVFNVKTGQVTHDHIPPRMDAIRNIITKFGVNPISAYLRYNKGEMSDGIETSKLTIADISYGWKSLGYSLNNKYLKFDQSIVESQSADAGRAPFQDINIKPMQKALWEFVSKDSRNPFDAMMRELGEAYDNGNHHINKTSKIESILAEAEAGILFSKRGLTDKGRKDIYDNLWDFVKTDFDFVKLSKIQDRVKSLQNEMEYYASRNDIFNAGKSKEKIKFYQELKADLEMKIGAEIDFHEAKNVIPVTRNIESGKKFVQAGDSHMVVWGKNGKIKEVIMPGEANVEPIWKGDTLVRDGRFFELRDPKEQSFLKAKHHAFNDVPVDMNSGVPISRKDMNGIIRPAYGDIWGEYIKAKQQHSVDGDSGLLVTKTQAIIHDYLNAKRGNIGITNSLLRRGLIWKLMTPQENKNVTTYSFASDGQKIYHNKYVGNDTMTKAIYGYLFGVYKGESFNANNVISRHEAGQLLNEISTRTNLAHLGINKRNADVVLQGGIGSEWYNTGGAEPRFRLNSDIYQHARNKGLAETEAALGHINDFIYDGKVMSPYDFYGSLEQIARGASGKSKVFSGDQVMETASGNTLKEGLKYKGSMDFGAEGVLPDTRRTPRDVTKEMETILQFGCEGGGS